MPQTKHSDGPCQIIKCPGCKPHPYQDKKYGPGMRVHNPGAGSLHCTVCGGSKPYAAAKKVEKPEPDKAEPKKAKK